MKKTILLSAISLALSGQAMAAAYKIPEQSLNSTALSGAYVANAHGADASYNNPAAMAFNEGGAKLEADLTFIYLNSIKAQNEYFAPYGPDYYYDETKSEQFLMPDLHYVSPAVGNARYGLSIVAPAGLTKRWKGVNRAFAEEFTLQTIEINPTIAYKVNERFSFGGGLRALYSKGIVRSADDVLPSVPFGRLMKGDSWDFGYNLALHFKANENLDLAVTYRSKIDLTEKGDAWLTGVVEVPNVGPVPIGYEGGASVEIPIPATLTLAGAYTFGSTTVELTYERNYWSAYEYLDFNYSDDINPVLDFVYGTPLPKYWKDSNTFRIGLTHQWNDRLTVMAGYAYDETPAPKKYLGYELPDSDANIFSAGFRYKYSDQLNFGAALLYDKKDKLTLAPGVNEEAFGTLYEGATFKDASAYLLTLGMEYSF